MIVLDLDHAVEAPVATLEAIDLDNAVEAPFNPSDFTWTKADALRLRALYEINRIRLRYELEPLTELPQGRFGDPYRCVVAIGLTGIAPTVSIGQSTFSRRDRGGRKLTSDKLPETLGLFIRLFDAGRYPDLVLPLASPLSHLNGLLDEVLR